MAVGHSPIAVNRRLPDGKRTTMGRRVEIGKEIKARSPFKRTFILTNCNGGAGYLPPAHRYPEGGYEVEISGFAPQAAGMVVESALKMLSSLRR